MVRDLLMRGMLAGLVAGLIVFSFGRLLGEPPVDRAISFETALDDAKAKALEAKGIHAEAEPELVSRKMQAGLGLFTGVMVYCTAFGGLFALVFAAVHGRIADTGPRATAALLGLIGFAAIYLVPNLKYPANPPSVGQPETIGHRTALYFIMMASSVAAATGAATWRKRLLSRLDAWSATLAAVAVYIVAVTALAFVLPAVNEVPDGFPAVVLWQFRIASIGMQILMWSSIGLVFGALTERDARSRFRLYQPTATRNRAITW